MKCQERLGVQKMNRGDYERGGASLNLLEYWVVGETKRRHLRRLC
jgi:hypothetical protein